MTVHARGSVGRIGGALGAALLGVWIAAQPALGAEGVTVRAWPHSGFGRIVFEFSSPVGFEARMDAGSVVMRFEREFEADYRRVRQHLGQYIGEITEGADGLSVTFALHGEYGLKSSALDNLVVVDLIDGARAAEAATSEDGETAADSAERLRVRTGIHPGFTRVVFDWTEDVSYTVSREGERVTVAFGRAATVELAAINRRPPRWIESAESHIEAGGLAVELRVPESARLRDFRSGRKVVVDILGKADETRVAEAVPQEPASPEKLPPPQPAASSTAAPEAAPEAIADAPEPPPQAPTQAESEAAATASPPEAVAQGEPTQLLPDELEPTAAAGVQDAGAPPQKEIAVTFPETEGLLRIAIAWRSPVAAAVFERAGHLWAVFDRPVRAAFDPIPPRLSEILFLAEQIGNANGTALRFKVRPGLHPTVTHRNGIWEIEFAAEAGALRIVIGIERESEAGEGPRVFLPVAEAGNLVEIDDPEVGDRLAVVPVHGPGRGVATERTFLQFAVLSTAQGVAIQPRADPIAVRTVRNGVEITSREELILSDPGLSRSDDGDDANAPPGGGERDLAALDAQATLPARLFDFERWRHEELGVFFEARAKLRAAIARAPEQARNAGRWELAAFNFAHGFYLEALGIMNVVAEGDPGIASDPAYRVVRGATEARLGRWDAAAELFGITLLDGSPEVALWRGAIASTAMDWDRARQEFAFGALAYEVMPVETRTWLRLKSVRAAFATKDFEGGDADLALALEEAPSAALVSESTLLLARGAAERGEIEAAVESYDEVIAGGYRPVAAEARRERAELLMAAGEIPFEEGVEELERLRFVWRGNDFERDLMYRLSEIYRDEGEYYDSLATLRELISVFPDDPSTPEVTQELNDTFRALFLDGLADSLSPLKAYSLYYDFRELTPVNEDGDAMLRALADRFASVDLYDRAAQTIEHQFEFRLSGAEKARVGAKLAVIYLLGDHPDKAIETLAASAWNALSKELVQERRLLEARALADLDRPDESLARLKGVSSAEAASIRADIHWRRQVWIAAAKAIDVSLGERWEAEAPLNEVERGEVLRMTVALSLAGNPSGVSSVRTRYGAKMEESPEAEAFAIITTEFDRSSIPFREIATTVAQLDTLDAFMAPYREKLQSGGLSAVN